MFQKQPFFVWIGLGLFLMASQVRAAEPVRIAKWKDDKPAAFMLLFDDSMTSHVKYVVPELLKRKMIGTFYVNPGGGGWAVQRKAWEKDLPAAGMVYANHTLTHKGVRDVAQAHEEIGQCNDAIHRVMGHRKPTLVSFGTPGVAAGAWNLTPQQQAEVLKKHQLIQRPDVNGRFAAIHLKTTADMIAIVDGALKKGSLDFVAFHGVGGEWLKIELPAFIELIDHLAAQRNKLWITDPISAHQYETQLATAKVVVIRRDAKQVDLKLTTDADVELYDQPMTLVVQVPTAWKSCTAVQGSNRQRLKPEKGVVLVDAVPDGTPIEIKP